jgi:adenylate kinase
MKTTKPVLDFYSRNPNFHEVDGTLKIDEITAKIDAFLNL